MKRLLLLTLLLLPLLACGDGTNLITQDAIENIAGCYEGTQTTDDHYTISLDRFCVDMELSGLPTTAPTHAVTDNPPVAIPTDAEWELIATLQRNPLRPSEFYLFDEDNAAIAGAYIAGKHFIFEIGGENKGRQITQARYYIIQPESPFQDKDKDALQKAHDGRTGFKSGLHRYHFETLGGWFITRKDASGRVVTGFTVEFSEFIKPTVEITLNANSGLYLDNYIKDSARLRIYVSR
ncbi:MAG: hypothetical protein OXU36_13775 [Candidatus Poribacteria bacterium]|nr:hypothetical protein [Candidatus Poribacteria bacterium]